MFSTEAIYQLAKWRQEELFREANQAGLSGSIYQERPRRRAMGSKIITLFRSRLSDRQQSITHFLDQQSISNPCCHETP